MIGSTLAHYQITGPLGKGGMGEVFRARDTKLGRDVAIKVLPPEMSRDLERLGRFDREARTLATLQHANVASIYGFETAGEVRFLVMELAEGEDLSERLQRGALPVEETVNLAIQLADGLAAAHAVGVIHRDLKPANIKVLPDGRLKILDFGLARAYGADDGSSSALEHSPTMTAMTQPGIILGTAAYMAPEQARGAHVDHRADIWAFGVVLFGMLTGRQVFQGETVTDTLASVLRAEVPWAELPSGTPPALRRLLERCLERDPSRRLQAIAEARIVLEDLKAGRGDDWAPPVAGVGGRRFGRERLVWIAAVSVLGLALAGMVVLREPAPRQPLVQSTLLPPPGWDFAPASPFAVSPDGSRIAFVAVARPDNEDVLPGANCIWIRDLAKPEAHLLESTDDGSYPFWSPDGRWVGFFAGGKLNKIEARGGPVIPICEGTDGRGASWSPSGTIIFQRAWSEGLMKVPAGGGTPEPLTNLNKERYDIAHRWPTFLPDGRHFLFYVVCTTNPTLNTPSGIYLGSLDGAEPRLLLKSESRGLYAQGHLLYRMGATLMAQPFDATSLRFAGDPSPVATDITGGAISWGGAQFGVSESGVLIHMRGAGAANTVLNWRDRSGQVLERVGDPNGFWEPSLSHDGKRVAVAIGQISSDIWILDLEGKTRSRFTYDPLDERTPQWSPNDDQLVYTMAKETQGQIFLRDTSGQVEPKLLYTARGQVELTDWSEDGRWVFFNHINPDNGGSEIWQLDMQDLQGTLLLAGHWFERASLSPDGRWLAFTSDESGSVEVYVQSYPEPTGRWRVSNDTGAGNVARPRWRKDGRELFYLRGGSVVAVPVKKAATFSFGEPTVLFSVSVTAASSDINVSGDGQRILTNELPPTNQNKIGARLIQNWLRVIDR